MKKLILALLAVMLICRCHLAAQIKPDTVKSQKYEQIYQIRTIDRNIFIGKIIERNKDEVILVGESNVEIKIPSKNILSITPVEKDNYQKGKYWFPNPNSTRYLFGPSSFNLKKGEGYYQNIYILMNSFNYGITDYLSMGAGFEIFTTITGHPVFWLMPKTSFKVVDKFRMGAGIIYFNILAKEDIKSDFTGLGIAYGTATYGTGNNNITFGMGYGFVNDDIAKKPILTGSAMCRLYRKIGLVSENWFVPDENNRFYNLYSYGIRFMSEKITIDFAFLNNPDIAKGLNVGIPYVDFVVKFGK